MAVTAPLAGSNPGQNRRQRRRKQAISGASAPFPCHADPRDHSVVGPTDGLQCADLTAAHDCGVGQEPGCLHAGQYARELAIRFCISGGEQALCLSYLALQGPAWAPICAWAGIAS